MMDIATIKDIVDLTGSISTLALALVAVVSLVRGIVVPASVVESIIAQTVQKIMDEDEKRRAREAAIADQRFLTMLERYNSKLEQLLNSILRQHNNDTKRQLDHVSNQIQRALEEIEDLVGKGHTQ